MELSDLWKVLAGVAIFLLGLRFMEDSLRQLSGRKFKLFLKKQTTSKIKAIGGGAIVTGILQSSSLVSLMVLAFVGAGVLSMQNALAVILGANLGTTLDSWIVATIGFKTNIGDLAVPVIGIAGITLALVNRGTRWYRWSMFFLGLSFLFFGLGLMKTGIEDLVKTIDIRQYENSPAIVFLGIGLLITSLIQSSSATIAITLSALYAGGITLFDATAIVLGAEIGTTLKLFIASLKGIAAKRRVALGNFMFNGINVFIIMLFIAPVNHFITGTIGIKDELIALVFFQSLVNITGIILFYPFLGVFGRFLERCYGDADDETMFIHDVKPGEPAVALFALENESRYFLFKVLDFVMTGFGIKNEWKEQMRLDSKFSDKPNAEKYDRIKFVYGEIHSFSIRIQHTMTGKEDLTRLDRLVSSIRNCMYAAKSMKDALPDIEQLKKSSNDVKYDFFVKTQDITRNFCHNIHSLISNKSNETAAKLSKLYTEVTLGYTASLQHLYKESIAKHVSETDISTLLNFNREVVTAFKSLVFAAKDYLLDREQSKHFEDLPGFIR